MSDASPAVLVVDDEAVVLRFITRVLEGRGYAARGAGSAEEALVLLAEDCGFRLLVADVHLETMSGPELLRAARKESPGLAALLMTGDHALAEGALSGVAPVLAKPFTPEDLLSAVARALERGPGAPDAR